MKFWRGEEFIFVLCRILCDLNFLCDLIFFVVFFCGIYDGLSKRGISCLEKLWFIFYFIEYCFFLLKDSILWKFILEFLSFLRLSLILNYFVGVLLF